jgi:hypothetical protein
MKKLNQEDLKRKKAIEDFLEERTSINSEKSLEELIEASSIIKQLNDFIDSKLELSSKEIESKIKRLISHFTITLIYEFNSEIALRRARKFTTEETSIPFCFDNLEDMLYVPESKKSIIPLGRFNKKEESIYYASIFLKENENEECFFETAISEINGIELDYINILDSIPTKYLNVVYIGVFDQLARNKQLPKWIDKYYYKTYLQFKKKCLEKGNRCLFESYLLSNAFFADIIQRNGSDRLYEVTSIISSILLADDNVDAIVYESVKVKNSPAIAIKPKVVDSSIEHKKVCSIRINENLGYGVYYLQIINKGSIDNNNLVWNNSLMNK